MALVMGIREEALVGLCQARELDVTNPAVETLIAMPDRTEKSLKALAPQAAKLAGPVMDKAPQVAAGAFVLILAISTFSTYRRIDALAKKVDAARERQEAREATAVRADQAA